jgi:hypothetical protein
MAGLPPMTHRKSFRLFTQNLACFSLFPPDKHQGACPDEFSCYAYDELFRKTPLLRISGSNDIHFSKQEVYGEKNSLSVYISAVTCRDGLSE